MDMRLETFIPLTFRRRGGQRVVSDVRGAHDVTLIDGQARAFYWQHLLDTSAMPRGSAISRAEKLNHSVVNALLRMSFLAPNLIASSYSIKQPRRLTLISFP